MPCGSWSPLSLSPPFPLLAFPSPSPRSLSFSPFLSQTRSFVVLRLPSTTMPRLMEKGSYWKLTCHKSRWSLCNESPEIDRVTAKVSSLVWFPMIRLLDHLDLTKKTTGLELLFTPMPRSPTNMQVFQWFLIVKSELFT